MRILATAFVSWALLASACSGTRELDRKQVLAPFSLTAADLSAQQVDGLCPSGRASVDFTQPGQGFAFPIWLAAGQTIEVRTAGDAAIDTVMCLFGPIADGEPAALAPLACDDDSGGGMLSRLVFEAAESGRYAFLVTTSGGRSRGRVDVLATLDGKPGGEVACVPDCAGRECGADGCGGTCGDTGGKCPNGSDVCLTNGTCTPCAPDCVGRDCGYDGCGGSCGSCDPDEVCLSAGTCSTDACLFTDAAGCCTGTALNGIATCASGHSNVTWCSPGEHCGWDDSAAGGAGAYACTADSKLPDGPWDHPRVCGTAPQVEPAPDASDSPDAADGASGAETDL